MTSFSSSDRKNVIENLSEYMYVNFAGSIPAHEEQGRA